MRRGQIERRARERLGLLELLDRAATAAEPEEVWLEGLDELFDELPAAQREAIELRVIADMRYEVVGQQLGISPATARVRVSRGLSALRHKLTPSIEETR